MNDYGLLDKALYPDGLEISITYSGPQGLLESWSDNLGTTRMYEYVSESGRLAEATSASGERITLKSDLSPEGTEVHIYHNGKHSELMQIYQHRGNFVKGK